MKRRTTIGRVILVFILMVVAFVGEKVLTIIIGDFARIVESVTPVVELYATQSQISIQTIINIAEWCVRGVWVIISILAVLAIFPSKEQ